MKKIFFIHVFFVLALHGFGQTYLSRSAFIGFYSKTPFEDIQAENQQAYAVVDLNSKQLAFAVLLKGFEFKKELMQTHFNENYVQSDKYPKASFSGSFTGEVSRVGDSSKVAVDGNLSLHGMTKNIRTVATMRLVNGKLTGHAIFTVKPQDFNISIPSLVREKIATMITVEVNLNANLKN